ncbi:hypothetical protein [Viridibacterium curvum]|uniref:PEP-CTERM sorting domain-containing protein n=1 Tax=Viridibacterium curvum TaxID=1101404 RepID=A0ABP9QWE1_9RHOO
MQFKPRQLAAVLGFALSLGLAASPASASYVVDTGTPTQSGMWMFNANQYFAGEFDLTSSAVLNSIEGFFSTDSGSVAISIHADGGSLPGSILYTANLTTGTGSEAWRGLSGLDWALTAGEYWVSFKPTFTSSYASFGSGVSSPMSQYAQGSGSYVWADEGPHFFDFLNAGVRIDATVAAVPEASTALMYGAGLLVLGGLARRRALRS